MIRPNPNDHTADLISNHSNASAYVHVHIPLLLLQFYFTTYVVILYSSPGFTARSGPMHMQTWVMLLSDN